METQYMDAFLEGTGMHLNKDGNVVSMDHASCTAEQLEVIKGLDKLLEMALQNALDAACLTIQNGIGIDAGDYAGMFFSGPDNTDAIRQTLFNYMTAEIDYGQAVVIDKSEGEQAGPEVLPGATAQEVQEVMMQDIVGDYEVPDKVPEWKWIQSEASYEHVDNGTSGVWEFVLNLSCDFERIPKKLKPVIAKAKADGIAYLIFHQGT